jgi:hypothetical protein
MLPHVVNEENEINKELYHIDVKGDIESHTNRKKRQYVQHDDTVLTVKDDTSIHQRDSDTKTATTVQQQVKKKKKSDHENIKTNKSKKSTQSQSSVRKRSINPHITELESTALYDIWSSNHDTTTTSYHVTAVHCCAHIHYNTFNVIKRDCVDV